MIDKKISNLLNQQLNKELYSSYLYLDISNYYYYNGLDGFGHWYNIQSKEELDHANLILQYIKNSGEKVILESIDKPKKLLNNFKDGLEISLEHECYVTSCINNLYEESVSIKDYRTMQFINWFIVEQGEEEKNAEELIQKFELFGHDSKSLYMLDKELKSRTYTTPSLKL